MIMCVVNDARKIRTFSVKVRLFVHLNDPYFLNGSYMNVTSLVAFTLNKAFCWAYNIWQLIFMIQRFLLSCYHHHHHDVRLARISLTLSLHVSLSFIAYGGSSGLHPISHSCCMNVRAGRPAFDWPYAGVHRSTCRNLRV